jgi:hypothetical protein
MNVSEDCAQSAGSAVITYPGIVVVAVFNRLLLHMVTGVVAWAHEQWRIQSMEDVLICPLREKTGAIVFEELEEFGVAMHDILQLFRDFFPMLSTTVELGQLIGDLGARGRKAEVRLLVARGVEKSMDLYVQRRLHRGAEEAGSCHKQDRGRDVSSHGVILLVVTTDVDLVVVVKAFLVVEGHGCSYVCVCCACVCCACWPVCCARVVRVGVCVVCVLCACCARWRVLCVLCVLCMCVCDTKIKDTADISSESTK